jgi:hypothetical protein
VRPSYERLPPSSCGPTFLRDSIFSNFPLPKNCASKSDINIKTSWLIEIRLIAFLDSVRIITPITQPATLEKFESSKRHVVLISASGSPTQRRQVASAMFEENLHLQDVLLTVALGHSLSGSKSIFATLSKDILQNILAVEIETCYWKSRLDIGLLTPPGLNGSRCDQVSEKDPIQVKEIRRETLLSPAHPRRSVAQFSKPFLLKENVAPKISSFIANRYADLINELQEEDQNLSSTSGARVRRPSSLTPRKFGRGVNDITQTS